MSYLVEDLIIKNMLIEAKGIYERNQCQGYIHKDILDKLNAVVYQKELDTSLNFYDKFEPISRPIENYI